MNKYLAAFLIIICCGCGQSESNSDEGTGVQESSNADSGKETSQKDWTAVLHKALAGATRLRVRSGGTCHRNREAEKTLLDVRDGKAVTKVLQQITIDSSGSGFHCMCCGNPTLEFYRGNKLVVSLGYHHGEGVRWLDGKWEGDGLLTDEAAEFLAVWMHERGISGPKEEYELGLRQRAEARVAYDKWLATIPSSLRSFWDKEGIPPRSFNYQEMNTVLSKQYPDMKERILALLQWHAADKRELRDDTAEQILFLYKTQDLLSAIRGVELTPEQTEGTWRLFEDSMFQLYRPEDYDRLPERVKLMLQEHKNNSDQD